MLDGCVDAIVFVWAMSLQWISLRWPMEVRRAFSGGDKIEVWDEWSPVRRGEGCPERERKSSWSMVAEAYVALGNYRREATELCIRRCALLWFELIHDVLS